MSSLHEKCKIHAPLPCNAIFDGENIIQIIAILTYCYTKQVSCILSTVWHTVVTGRCLLSHMIPLCHCCCQWQPTTPPHCGYYWPASQQSWGSAFIKVPTCWHLYPNTIKVYCCIKKHSTLYCATLDTVKLEETTCHWPSDYMFLKLNVLLEQLNKGSTINGHISPKL